jgi:hypothetical protein
MPSHSSTHPTRKVPTPNLPTHVERQKKQQSRMVREQPDDTPRDQRIPGAPLGSRQMG